MDKGEKGCPGPTRGVYFTMKYSGVLAVAVIINIMWLFVCSYMVDAADQDKLEASKNEFHNLLDKPQLNGIPVLVLANKRDLPGALDEREVIDRMYV